MQEKKKKEMASLQTKQKQNFVILQRPADYG